MTRRVLLAAVLAAGLCGCGGDSSDAGKVPIKLDEVPEPAMKTAKEKLPGITFHEAYRKKNGTLEVRGKDKGGKVREVEVKPDGTFVALE